MRKSGVGYRMAAVLLTVVCLAGTVRFPVTAAENPEENIIVVIDPGHGGNNLGGEYNTLQEKNLTIVSAFAMKAELEKYEGITVYMTRTEDVALSLAERAKIAKNVSADYFISLHYNMSVEHDLYGSEVWIPSLGQNYVKGYAMGNLVLDELDRFGLYRRGVKTKINARSTDYYGVLRECTKYGIPSVLVEHCHLDNSVDKKQYNSIENLQKFGRADATAVAKYFGLSSKELGVDYSGCQKQQVAAPVTPVAQDITDPELSKVSVTYNHTDEDGMLGIKIEGSDKESGIYYYSYSLDGGATWSALQTMPYGTKSVTMDVRVPKAPAKRQAVVRVYNGYDRKTESVPAEY